MAVMRISCAALCRIQDDDGRYLLALNANRLRAGIEVMMPLGGALSYTDPRLLERFGAVPENPAKSDLRWYMDQTMFPDFRTWFYRRIERETSPLRELQEELVEEMGVLTDLHFDSVDIHLVGVYESERITERSNVTGMLTHYWNEVYTIVFAPPILAVLSSSPPKSGLRWVMKNDIRTGKTADAVRVDATILLGES